jgi:hypothetical protein
LLILFHESSGTSTGSGSRANADTRSFSTADFQSEIGRLIDASLATNTKDTYRTGLQSFDMFRKDYELNDIWPPPPSHIVLFIAYLSLKGKAHKTVICYVAAISFRLQGSKTSKFGLFKEFYGM